MPTWLDDLRETVGVDDVLVDDDLRAGHEIDWTGRWRGRCDAVVRPRSTSAVAAALATCSVTGVIVVAQGGNTGLVGGGVPRDETLADGRPTVVLSTRNLTDVSDVDAVTMQLTAGAGVTIAAWRDAARSSGLDTPVDFAARDSATIGGAIATNAGGSRVVRFGTMRSQVTGVEVVLADGSVVGSLDGLPKETAGVHWPSLVASSEGTLGVITRARLRLVPSFAHTVTALVSLASLDDALGLLATARRSVPSLDSIEFLLPAAYDLVNEHLGRPAPVERPGDDGVIVVVECADHDDPTAELADLVGSTPSIDTAVATDPTPRRTLLDVRDRVTEAIAAASTAIGEPTFKLDVAVPPSRLGELIDVARRAAADDGCRLIPFGHLAEGNVHLNHLGAHDPEHLAATVLPAVADLGGTISAEHGIGVAKAAHLGIVRGPADLDAQRALKLAVDPGRILNPGVLGR